MRVLITGGTGSLGRALLKRIYGTCEVTILSRDETKQNKLRAEYPDCRFILADISSIDDLELAFSGIDIVYHFAAYKQVPSAQDNVLSTIRTNIDGSRNVAYAAVTTGVKKVVASSTDKACEPVNLYGASKSVMESIFQHFNKYNKTSFHLARYGNVVGSNASVVPLFKKQSAIGGPLTVTHKDMTRFWISIETAVDLIQAALLAPAGVIVVPEAKSLGIVKVAKLIGGDLPVKEIGIRPGEKIHESMISEAESFHTKVFSANSVRGIDNLFYVYPPTTMSERFSHDRFTYTSDQCTELTDSEFMSMVNDC